MSQSPQQLLTEALKMPLADRGRLAALLIESLEPDSEEDIAAMAGAAARIDSTSALGARDDLRSSMNSGPSSSAKELMQVPCRAWKFGLCCGAHWLTLKRSVPACKLNRQLTPRGQPRRARLSRLASGR